MPEISRFFGIIILMFADFHVRYGDYEAIVTIDTEIVNGELPTSVIKSVSKWQELHREELITNWTRLQNGTEANKIEPLTK